MICLTCGHYVTPDGEMEREQQSGSCQCPCHPWNQPTTRRQPVIGWTEGDGSGHEGYNVADYFDAEGRYLGPDEHGIEPIF